MRRRVRRITAVAVFAVMLTACAPMTAADAARDVMPRPVNTPAPEARAVSSELPPRFEGLPVVDPGWAVMPQSAGGTYLSMSVADDRVVFSAVADRGTVLWTAERPMLCSAFVVTEGAGRPLAILMNVEADTSAFSKTSVTAYDLRTGADVWGPVAVPGPHVGPGLVFAAPPPASLGESGPRVAIDPSTGEVLADEAQQNVTILGESDGIVLIASGARLIARTADAAQLWTLDEDRLGLLEQAPLSSADVTTDGGVALLGDRDAGATLVNLVTGDVIARAVRSTLRDQSNGIRIVLDHKLHAISPNGQSVWSRDIDVDARLVSAGAGAAYVRGHDGIRVFDTTSGETLTVLGHETVIPQQITRSGAGILGTHSQPLMVARPGTAQGDGG